jgi:uncharacterized OB-fold protein
MPENSVELMSPLALWQDHLEAGRFMLQRCNGCCRHLFYPRVLCPFCGGEDLEWRSASGVGTVYSTTVVARRDADGGPYNVALVDLDEGVRMMSRVEAVAPEAVAIGQRVCAFIGRIDDRAAVLFRQNATA